MRCDRWRNPRSRSPNRPGKHYVDEDVTVGLIERPDGRGSRPDLIGHGRLSRPRDPEYFDVVQLSCLPRRSSIGRSSSGGSFCRAISARSDGCVGVGFTVSVLGGIPRTSAHRDGSTRVDDGSEEAPSSIIHSSGLSSISSGSSTRPPHRADSQPPKMISVVCSAFSALSSAS